jgi:hypothetical protein
MSASKFDRLERKAGETGRRRAREEAVSRFLAVIALGCPELSARAFETHYREALEDLDLADEQATLPHAPPVPLYPAKDGRLQWSGVPDLFPDNVSVRNPQVRARAEPKRSAEREQGAEG